MSVQANCPACGAPVVFQVGTSLVTVCPYCRSAVARGDRGLESLGKVADLVETASPLDVGLKGRFDNVPFTLVGRTQFLHSAGGVWEEWYAAFGDGRWGWLAEAQGRFYITFVTALPENPPDYAALELGQKIPVEQGKALVVAEKNRARVGGVVGEIPYRFVPGEELPFADLSGPRGEFGTLDFSEDPPSAYLGRQVTLDELHIPPSVRRKYPGQEPTIQALQLNCPQCGATLALRAPDRSERVGCPSCGALSDVREGHLKLLRSLEPPPVQPILPLGAVGKRDGIDWTVIGFMQRYVTFEGIDYYWEEYLLYQPRLGFRWLTRSDEHWSWVEALPPGAVEVKATGATYAGGWYRLFQKAKAKVSFVVGEFYWKVQAGETVHSRDYVAAPYMLSEEVTKDEGEGEFNWSFGSYLPATEVEQIFGLKTRLPTPAGIGPNQPFPYSGVYSTAVYLLLAACCLFLVVRLITPRRVVYDHPQQLQPLAAAAPGAPGQPVSVAQKTERILVEEPLEFRGHRNIRFILNAPQATGWVYVQGSLDSLDPPPEPGASPARPRNVRRPFALMASSGRPAHVFLSAVPAGKYTLSYNAVWQNQLRPATAEIRIEQGVPRLYPLVLILLTLGAIPVLVAFYQMWYESRRWADSNVT